MYKVFVRNWWKVNQEWPNGLEPDSNARMTTIGYADSEDEAKQILEDALCATPSTIDMNNLNQDYMEVDENC